MQYATWSACKAVNCTKEEPFYCWTAVPISTRGALISLPEALLASLALMVCRWLWVERLGCLLLARTLSESAVSTASRAWKRDLPEIRTSLQPVFTCPTVLHALTALHVPCVPPPTHTDPLTAPTPPPFSHHSVSQAASLSPLMHGTCGGSPVMPKRTLRHAE